MLVPLSKIAIIFEHCIFVTVGLFAICFHLFNYTSFTIAKLPAHVTATSDT